MHARMYPGSAAGEAMTTRVFAFTIIIHHDGDPLFRLITVMIAK